MKVHTAHGSAWAIWLGLTDFDRDCLRRGQSIFTGHGYMGVLFFTSWTAISPWHHGTHIALFETRRAARDALRRHKQGGFGWPRARVEKVYVDVREQE